MELRDNHFFVTMQGTIDNATLETQGLCYLRFRLLKGQDWRVVQLSDEVVGAGPVRCGVLQQPQRYAYNFPICASFASTNPHGWPKLVVGVHQQGAGGDKGDPAVGSGWCHLPMSSGRHQIEMPLFVPELAPGRQSVLGKMQGHQPQFRDLSWIAQPLGREVTRVKPVNGTVRLTINVTVSNE
eukprot:gene571-2470_t